MCGTFYCENNQQCLNLLRFAWMIPLSIDGPHFVMLAVMDAHLLELIYSEIVDC